MAIEVFTITKRPNPQAARPIAQAERLEPVNFTDINTAIQFALISLPKSLKSVIVLLECVLEHDDVSITKKTEIRRILSTITQHTKELDSLRVNSRKLIANLDDARLFFVLNFNESIKLNNPAFNPQLIHDSYQRQMETFGTTLEQVERQKKGFSDVFERVHETLGDKLLAQYREIMAPAASILGGNVAARLNRVKLYLDPTGPFSQEGKFLHGAFGQTARNNVVLELRNMSALLDADSKNMLFIGIPGFPRQILVLRRAIYTTSIAYDTSVTDDLDDDEKMGIRDLQNAFTRLFTVDFPALHHTAVDAIAAETQGRFHISEAPSADGPSSLDPDPADSAIINALEAKWKIDLARLSQDSKKLSKNEEDFYFSIEIPKIKALVAQPGCNRKSFPDLLKFFTTQTRVCEHLTVEGSTAQYFACSPYLWPKELLPVLCAIKNHINGVICILRETDQLLSSIIQIIEAHPAVTWSDFLLSVSEKQARAAVHDESVLLKKRIRANCNDFLTRFIKIEEQYADVWFSSERDYNTRCHLFVLAEPPIDYTRDISGRKKLIIALRNPIEINILILCLRYYNFLARIPNTKIEIICLNSQDLNDKIKSVELNAKLSFAFAAAATAPLTQFFFVIDEVYLVGGCVRAVDKNYKFVLLDSYLTGTISGDLYAYISKICAHYGITFDCFATLPHYGANHGFAAMEAIAYLSRQDFNQPAAGSREAEGSSGKVTSARCLMTADNNDGFTILNLSKHMRRLQGSRVLSDAVAGRAGAGSPGPGAGPGIVAQLAQLEQCMTAFSTSERIYRLGLRNRWSKLIKAALQDSDFKTQTDAGKSFHATITSVTIAPPIESPVLTSTINELNFFPLVPPTALERIEAARRTQFEAQSLVRIEADHRARLEAETKARLEADRRAAAASPRQIPATTTTAPNISAMPAAITAAISTSIIPAAMRSASAPLPQAGGAPTTPHSSFGSWFSRAPRSTAAPTAGRRCAQCNGTRAITAPPCPACKM